MRNPAGNGAGPEDGMADAIPFLSAGGGAGELLCRTGLSECVWLYDKALMITQIVFADIILSGDNALVIGMAAATVTASHRRVAIVFGLGMAALLRIVFAIAASYLLKIPGILLIGGLLLSWVCWRFYQDLKEYNRAAKEPDKAITAAEENPSLSPGKQLRKALITITAADVSMSLDNVIAVAAIAREDTVMLVFGLSLAIVLMAFCATIIMKVLTRYPALSWAGLLFLVYLSLRLLYDGAQEVLHLMGHLS